MATITTHTTQFINRLNEKFAEQDVHEDDKFSAIAGRKYDKVIFRRAAYLFIDRNTGHMYKAASWSAPNKGFIYYRKDETSEAVDHINPFSGYRY